MRRFWLVIGALAGLNLAVAAALTIWMPAGIARGPAPPAFLFAPQVAPPVVRVPRERSTVQFESRVRTVMLAEMQRLGMPVPNEPGPRREIGFDGQTPGTRARVERGQDRIPGQDREVNAVLTPFGVFRAGPTGLLMVLVTLATFAAAGTVALYLMPAQLNRVTQTVAFSRTKSLRLGIIGMLAYVLAAALVFVLVALVTGILFAILVSVLLAAATFAGLVAMALVLGRWLRSHWAPEPRSPIADLLVGVLALFPLGLIPWIGWLFVLVLAALGLGALLATKFGSEEGWSLEPLRGGF